MKASVQDDDCSAIRRPSQEAAETLFEGDRHGGQQVGLELVPGPATDRLEPRLGDRVAQVWERKLFDGHKGECFAGYINALPERAGTEEDRFDSRAEFVQKRLARAVALRKHRYALRG